MRDKLFITHGTLGLALAASVFIGCQDFLGSDKGGQAKPSDNNLQHAAQASSQDSAAALPVQAAAGTPATAQDVPANAIGNGSQAGAPSSQPAATETVKSSTPAPYTPLDSAQICAMYRKNVVTLPTTGDPKYDAYMAQLAIACAGYP